MLIATVVGILWVSSTISDCGGTVQAVNLLMDHTVPDSGTIPEVPRGLIVSPAFKVIEAGVGRTFDVTVTNLSSHGISGSVLRLEVRPAATFEQFHIEPPEHPRETLTLGGISVLGSITQAEDGPTGTVWSSPLDTIAPNASITFRASAHAPRDHLLQISGSVVPRGAVQNKWTPFIASESEDGGFQSLNLR